MNRVVSCTIEAHPEPAPQTCSGTTAATDSVSPVTHVRNSDNNRHVTRHNFCMREWLVMGPRARIWRTEVLYKLTTTTIYYRVVPKRKPTAASRVG